MSVIAESASQEFGPSTDTAESVSDTGTEEARELSVAVVEVYEAEEPELVDAQDAGLAPKRYSQIFQTFLEYMNHYYT